MLQDLIDNCFPAQNIEVQLTQYSVRQIAFMITDAYERLSRSGRRRELSNFETLLRAINVDPQLLDLIQL